MMWISMAVLVLSQFGVIERSCEEPVQSTEYDTSAARKYRELLRDSNSKSQEVFDFLTQRVKVLQADTQNLPISPLLGIDSSHIGVWPEYCDAYLEFLEDIQPVCENSTAEEPVGGKAKGPTMRINVVMDSMNNVTASYSAYFKYKDLVSNREPLEIVDSLCYATVQSRFEKTFAPLKKAGIPGDILLEFPKDISKHKWCCDLSASDLQVRRW